ncbi:hypothetical protein GCM10010246_27770 [Streptomyces cuspidosporus]|uniref:Uncharacterized protein n=1 Tax=Streptomyces cuspidosporus TaxID=66882 RepID=A0ABN3FZM6_9ACTN
MGAASPEGRAEPAGRVGEEVLVSGTETVLSDRKGARSEPRGKEVDQQEGQQTQPA